MKNKISILSYIGIFGIPVLLMSLVIANILRMSFPIQILKILLVFAAIGYAIAGIYEVFLREK